MMKNFMISGGLLQRQEARGDPGGKGVTPIPGEVEVMTTFD
jgi:hypothetical protein